MKLNGKQRKTLAAIQRRPVPSGVTWVELESLLGAMGYEIMPSKGSNVTFIKDGYFWRYHRPHPRKEVDKGAIAGLVQHLKEVGEI
jgi:predicted RNA binding protein YcfA (HicA-like mRNA interferase family)